VTSVDVHHRQLTCHQARSVSAEAMPIVLVIRRAMEHIAPALQGEDSMELLRLQR